MKAIPALLAIGLAGIVGATLATAAPQAGAAMPTDRAAIEKIVREYILAHPEIIPEAMNRLQGKLDAKRIAENRKAIETPFPGAVAGNPKGDVTLAVFFDYACPYCRRGHEDVKALLAADPKLRVVYRDFPVLSPASEEAAMASLSAATQGRYTEFHDAMFETPGKVGRDRTLATARAARLDEARTVKDLTAPALKAEVERNLTLGRALGLTGTPSYVVGDRILSGAVGVEKLKDAVAAAREAKAG